MKVYISGKISGLPIEEAKAKFKKAEKYLHELGHTTVNPLENGLDFNDPWEDHMLHDISKLIQCEAIYLLEDWIDSRGALIEKLAADISGKKIMFQSQLESEKLFQSNTEVNLFKIKGAIQEVMGLTFEQYETKSRNRKSFFARMIFAYYCFEYDLEPKQIAKFIHRDFTTVHHYLRKYNDECKYNPSFRSIAQKISQKLNKNMYHANT